MTPDDRIHDLVVRAKERDEAAFAELVEATQVRLISRIARTGLQRADAEAVAFTVYREAWQWMTRLRDPSRFEAWIGVIGRRKASDERRRERLRRRREEELVDHHLESLEGEPGEERRVRRQEELEQLFAGLDATDRRLLEAKYLDRVTIHEIARVTGFKIHQIKHRLKKAKERLRRLRSGETEVDPEDERTRAQAPGDDERRHEPLGVVTPAGKRGNDE
ncbi:MAG: RNA polymerase sigma factor [Planctomycetota bacterium JB042]